MELEKLKAEADSLSQLLYGSAELADMPNGLQIAATVESLFTELLRVIGQLQQDVAAVSPPRS